VRPHPFMRASMLLMRAHVNIEEHKCYTIREQEADLSYESRSYGSCIRAGSAIGSLRNYTVRLCERIIIDVNDYLLLNAFAAILCRRLELSCF